MKRAVRLLLCALAAGTLTAATGYQVNYGANMDITEFSTCKNVSNAHASGKAIFAPTNTSTEWSTFYGHPPAGVTISACAPPCGGKPLGGYCWYQGATSGSCTTACSSHGGVLTAGIVNYAGSSGTDANCTAVGRLFYPSAILSTGASNALGCSYNTTGSSIIRFHGSTTTAGATLFGNNRFCSCTN